MYDSYLRWNKVVDFGSPMTAWSSIMLDVWIELGPAKTFKEIETLKKEVTKREVKK
jgi:hypothetical protein